MTRRAQFRERLLTLLEGRALTGLDLLTMTGMSTMGPLYVALHVLEVQGRVQSWWGDERPPERGYARRRYYTATALPLRSETREEPHA